jgi:hypothetical protein
MYSCNKSFDIKYFIKKFKYRSTNFWSILSMIVAVNVVSSQHCGMGRLLGSDIIYVSRLVHFPLSLYHCYAQADKQQKNRIKTR